MGDIILFELTHFTEYYYGSFFFFLGRAEEKGFANYRSFG